MPKGQSTRLGRIMAGSHAVIAHDDAGQALFVAYYPPDIHGSQGIVAYGQQVAWATGTSLFGIDRAVHAGAMARAVDDQGVGLLCRRDDNEHQGLASCEAPPGATLEEGTRV
jgi:hypothetical protein